MSTPWKAYLETQGAHLSPKGHISDFQPGTSGSPGLFPLESQAIIEISGTDRQRFLQGQLSCDMNRLKPGYQTRGLACTPKGRMYASFTLVDTGTCYLLRMHQGIVSTLIEQLSKYAVFYQTRISQPERPMVVLGLSGEAASQALIAQAGQLPEDQQALSLDQGILIRTPMLSHSHELWLFEDQLQSWWPALAARVAPAPESHWRRQEIQAGITRIQPEHLEKYTPQQLNFPSLGYVSFRKGCYTGQEIIARMQNLGQAKSRAYPLACQGADHLSPGSRLSNSQGQSVGEILDSAPNGAGGCVALGLIRTDASQEAVYLADNPACTLTVAPIPYPIDPRAELQQ